jgi:type III pantothenate kinase
VLTVDLGNSRLKARLWDARDPARCIARLDLAGAAWEELERWLTGIEPRSALAVLSSVASPERTRAVSERLSRASDELLVRPPAGLDNHCRPPEDVGSDRLYAAAGAAALLGRSCLVVDAGTALTVDVLSITAEGRSFLGGAIAPGPALLAMSLASGTALLPRIEPRAGARALGQSTEEALQAGVVVGFRGAALRLVEELAREARLEDGRVVLTGGARALLLEPEPFTTREIRVEEDLVHRGLIDAAQRVTGARGSGG